MNYRYNKADIQGIDIMERCRELGVRAKLTNRENCKHLPELVAIAERDLLKAKSLPHATSAQQKVKDEAIAQAELVLNIRQQKLALYKEIFPDLF